MSILKLRKSDENRALEIFSKSIVIDCLQASIFNDEYFDLLKRSGVTVVHKTIATNHNLSETIKNISNFIKLIHDNSDKALLIEKFDDILRAKRERRVGVIFGFQNVNPLEGDVNLLNIYYRLGVRIIQLSYNDRSLAADGCGEKIDCGLSYFGVEVIERMNKLKMIVDISHMGERSSLEAIDYADYVICSHANARSVCYNVRNKSDEVIMALAEKDGVIGVNAFPAFVKRTRMEIGERPTINDLLDHIDYIVNLVGIKHVGLGLDFIDNWPIERHKELTIRPDIWGNPTPKGIYEYPIEIENASKIINIARGLVVRGYSDREIKMILGENWLRIFRKIL